MKRIVEAVARRDYRLWLRYSDGTEGEVDLSDLAGRGVFASWKNRHAFEGVRVDGSGAVVWEGGLDLCPDSLYMRLTGKQPEDVFPGLRSVPTDA